MDLVHFLSLGRSIAKTEISCVLWKKPNWIVPRYRKRNSQGIPRRFAEGRSRNGDQWKRFEVVPVTVNCQKDI